LDLTSLNRLARRNSSRASAATLTGK
jgi:hypothetical protein